MCDHATPDAGRLSMEDWDLIIRALSDAAEYCENRDLDDRAAQYDALNERLSPGQPQ